MGAGSPAITETITGLDRIPTKTAAAGPWFGCFLRASSSKEAWIHPTTRSYDNARGQPPSSGRISSAVSRS